MVHTAHIKTKPSFQVLSLMRLCVLCILQAKWAFGTLYEKQIDKALLKIRQIQIRQMLYGREIFWRFDKCDLNNKVANIK